MPRPWTETSEREAYANALRQAVKAEEVGFDRIWLTEQHFYVEIGHSAAPDMLLAAISQRTTRIRLGFGVIVLPCHHPFQVAERVATLDVLSVRIRRRPRTAPMALARSASSKNLAPPWAQHEASVSGAGARPFA